MPPLCSFVIESHLDIIFKGFLESNVLKQKIILTWTVAVLGTRKQI